MTKAIPGGGGGAIGPQFGPGAVATEANAQALQDAEGAFANVAFVLPLSLRPAGGGRLTPKPPTPGGNDPPPPPSEAPNMQSLGRLSAAVGFPASFDSGDPLASVMACMLALQKMMNKESREDKKLYRQEKKTELSMKAEKLDMESTKIHQMASEAGERYDAAETAANVDMVVGICSIGLSIVGAVTGDGGGKLCKILDTTQSTIFNRANFHNKNFNDYQKQNLQSDQTQLQINDQQKRIDKQTDATEESKTDADGKKDMKTRGLDNLQKLLDIIRSINPQI